MVLTIGRRVMSALARPRLQRPAACAGRGGRAARAADMQGFRAPARPPRLQLEQRFDADLSAADLRAWMEQMASEPNHVGSPHDKANAEFQLQKFKEWGWDATIETFSVLYPTPQRGVGGARGAHALHGAVDRTADRGRCRTSAQTKDELPPYNVYGADGDVTAELVYVNQGMPDDYKELERAGRQRQGPHRAGPLRRRLARTQTEAGLRARRRRLLDLFRSARRRLWRGRCLSEGRLSAARCRAARLGAGPDLVQRRSADARASARPRAPSASPSSDAKTMLKIPVLPISYADAEPLARRARRPRGAARPGAAVCRSPITWVRARRKCI